MARLETRGAGVRASNVPRQRARITCRCAPNRTPSREEDGVARRHVVSIGGLVSVGLGLGLGLKSPARAEEGKYERTKLGVPYEEVYVGTNADSSRVVQVGDDVLIDYVMRRSNGYFIYGTVEGVSFQPSDVPAEPFFFRVGDEGVIPGLSDVVLGMRKGGKRRALIAPRYGYTGDKEFTRQPKELTLQPLPPTFATKRQLLNHCNEPLLFEVQLVKIIK